MLPARNSTESSDIYSHQAGRDFPLVHLTVIPREPCDTHGAAARALKDAAQALRRLDVHVLQEKIYGEVSESGALLQRRESCWRDHGLDAQGPVTMVGDPPAAGGMLAGVQITGVARRETADLTCETVRQGSQAVGRELTGPGVRLLYLADLNGLGGSAGSPADAPDQAAEMFQRADALLRGHGFKYTDVARTWIYVSRLLDWYDDFNAVRTAFFRRVGVIDQDGRGMLPASTGIQGHHPRGAECFMDLVAMTRTATGEGEQQRAFSQIRSSHQCEASDYGSSFSRGMELPLGQARLLYVSGTASINQAGETVHLDDDRRQIQETLTAAGAVLGHVEASLEQVVTAVGFHKTAANYAAWQALASEGLIPSLPMIQVVADVCRHDLLYEIEPAAVL